MYFHSTVLLLLLFIYVYYFPSIPVNSRSNLKFNSPPQSLLQLLLPQKKTEDVPAPARAITVVSGIKIRVMSASSLEKKLNYDATENKLDLVVLTETWLLKCIKHFIKDVVSGPFFNGCCLWKLSFRQENAPNL